VNIGYSNMTDREYDKAPKLYQFLHFHYLLYLDDDGKKQRRKSPTIDSLPPKKNATRSSSPTRTRSMPRANDCDCQIRNLPQIRTQSMFSIQFSSNCRAAPNAEKATYFQRSALRARQLAFAQAGRTNPI